MAKTSKDKTIIRAINQKKIITIDTLTSLLSSSVTTSRRRLKLWEAITSYNENGRYYTLPGIPDFDANGLWCYRQVHFSRYGNLKNTIIHLVTESKRGLDAADMYELLGVTVRSFLSSLKNHPDLKREKIQGRFIYFSGEEKNYIIQKERRSEIAKKIQMPSDIEAITILVEAIKNPGLNFHELWVKLQEKNCRVSPESVQNLFNYHGLTIKKMPDLIS